MQRHAKEASELKALILADLHKEPGCGHVTDFVIQRLETKKNGANWTVKYLDPNQEGLRDDSDKHRANVAAQLRPS
ncbi:hypothetical protein [Mesorhizobium delmotii]|uniref:Uncharacterized protein n=1 Tax=Mesorhizobium delmotii TaxID=1631247 RepID=A0A2P9AHF7_9HYPH|nr:hypothetical protein [Mesorhizobium delmotii]SJM30586.1 hypothetical protein BQ8482_160061 [Mesorhizobium delmotii]